MVIEKSKNSPPGNRLCNNCPLSIEEIKPSKKAKEDSRKIQLPLNHL